MPQSKKGPGSVASGMSEKSSHAVGSLLGKGKTGGPKPGKPTLLASPSKSPVGKPSTPVRGPSLMGIFAAKRLTNKLRARVLERRAAEKAMPKEPTYRMEPLKKFQPKKVEDAIKEVVGERINDKTEYNPRISKMLTRVISEEVKQKVKSLNFDRYKLVCMVTIGEKRDQTMLCTSRCIWDTRFDSYSAYTFENPRMFCTVTVYGIYAE